MASEIEQAQEPADAAGLGGFRARLEDPSAPVAMDLGSERPCALVAFGGIAGALGMPPFEFFRIAAGLECKRIFVRDVHQAWYQGGLPGICGDFAGMASFLRDQLACAGVERLVLVGNSMGGFAALLCGVLLRADVVHAFSPQTFIDSRTRRFFRDRRWAEQVQRAQELGRLASEHFDVKPALRSAPPALRAHVHFSLTSRLDCVHALRLLPVPCVRLHPHGRGGHNAIKHLRETGELAAILSASLGG